MLQKCQPHMSEAVVMAVIYMKGPQSTRALVSETPGQFQHSQEEELMMQLSSMPHVSWLLTELTVCFISSFN